MRRIFFIINLATILIAGLPLGSAVGATPQPDLEQMSIQKVDKSDFPVIKLRLGLTTQQKAREFQVKENDRAIANVKVSSQDDKEPVAVTLLIDVSGSMKGQPLEGAKRAAKVFVMSARPKDRIAIVAFSSDVERVADFTDDKAALAEAIDGLEARGETAVFDALHEALNAANNQALGRHSMILLSDGADTASQVSAGTVGELAEKLEIPVSAIALESPEFDQGPLEEVARRSGGRLITALSSKALVSLYDGLAAELHNRYQITFTSETEKSRANIEVETEVDGRKFQASTVLTGLRPVPPEPVRQRQRLDVVNRFNALAHPWFAAGLAFAAVFLGSLALSSFWRPAPNTMAEQLKYYDQLHGRVQADPGEPLAEKIQRSFVEVVKRVSIKYKFTEYAQQKLEEAGLPLKVPEYITAHLAAVVLLGLATVLVGGNTFLVLCVVIVAVAGPLIALEIAIGRRKNSFNDQLPDTLDMLASSLRAGYGLQQAVVSAGREAREPTAGELKRVANQVQLGMPLEDALNRMNKRIGNDSFKWVVLAIAIHRETGGNLAEIFDNLAASLRQRERMRRQIKGLTAEGRLSALILIVLPFLEGFIMFYLNPSYMSSLVTTVTGLVMLSMAVILMTGGGLWLRQIVNIDY